jgi:hypothetical protein
MMGAPVATAALNAPSWNGRTPSSAVKVPSGKTKTDSPLRRNSSSSCAWRNRDSLQERANEGHAADFHFRDETVRHAQPQHQRQHVEITRVIRSVDFCARRFHVLLAGDAHIAP